MIDDDVEAWAVLEAAGYRELRNGFVYKDGVVRWSDMAPAEQNALAYLCDEWDYGGLCDAEGRPCSS